MTDSADGRRPDWLTTRPIAHRGLCADGLVENSLGAFAACIDAGHPVELDVQLAATGEVIVFHDHRLKRLTGDERRVAETGWAAMKALRLKAGEERIPLLAEVLELTAGRIPILVEIKNEGDPGDLEQRTADLVSAYRGEIAVQSFNPHSVEAVRRRAPELIRGQLSTDHAGQTRMPREQRAALRNLWLNTASQPDFVAYDVHALSEARMARLRRRLGDMPLILWTARYKAQAAFARRMGCNIIYEPLV